MRKYIKDKNISSKVERDVEQTKREKERKRETQALSKNIIKKLHTNKKMLCGGYCLFSSFKNDSVYTAVKNAEL